MLSVFHRSLQFYLLAVFCFVLNSCARPQQSPLHTKTEGGESAKPVLDVCPFQWDKLQLCMYWSWLVKPTANQKGSMLLKMTRPHSVDKSPVLLDLNYELRAILWMPSMGHGSIPTRIKKVDVGSWVIENIYFNMPGDWELRLSWWEAGVLKDEGVLAFNITW